MVRVLPRTLLGTIILLWTFSDGSAFHFQDFDFYEQSSTVINSACPSISAAIKLVPFYRPNIDKVSFQLRTPCIHISVKVNDSDIFRDEPAFDVNKETVVLVTGWRSHLDEDYTVDMERAYHCRGGHNFLVVDTADYIGTEFIKSASNIEKLGAFIAVGLQKLGVPPQRIHLIGHSLGAHIMGSAGRTFYSETGEKIKRITGLDPARPCFKTPSVFPPLSRDDAEFVDIIHSNPGELGMEETVGHADFFPNGLEDYKPGCSHLNLKCSHIMSLSYYTESVLPGNEYNFMGTQCDTHSDLEEQSCMGPGTPMGYTATDNARGIYLLRVNEKSPYGMNTNGNKSLDSTECGLCAE